MDCKELTLELRTNKLKYATYTSLGGVLLFLLSSVIYLLVIVSHLNSIIDATNSRHLMCVNNKVDVLFYIVTLVNKVNSFK